jgi:hypothetical protein
MADCIARIRAVAAEIDALYMIRAAAEHAVESGDLAPLRRAVVDLRIAERVRRGAA